MPLFPKLHIMRHPSKVVATGRGKDSILWRYRWYRNFCTDDVRSQARQYRALAHYEMDERERKKQQEWWANYKREHPSPVTTSPQIVHVIERPAGGYKASDIAKLAASIAAGVLVYDEVVSHLDDPDHVTMLDRLIGGGAGIVGGVVGGSIIGDVMDGTGLSDAIDEIF